MPMSLTHFNERGEARMVNVGGKTDTLRVAVAEGRVVMKPDTLRLIMEGGVKKGDVLNTARLAGIMAAKKTGDLIPLCHPVPIHAVELELAPQVESSSVLIRARVETVGKTGVEMDALMAVSVAALTVYDMVKSAGKDMEITGISLLEKSGGKSGHYIKPGHRPEK
ncbi:MAG: cyclic pyranopterin monophosphate synthase MoaC [Nitrospinae bacterium]|nr:cyclic pyranopterin monophosphate synthase MoaC [Nitrospinota bacterium]